MPSGVYKRTEEMKIKKRLQVGPNKGKKFSTESRMKMSQAQKGKKLSKETRGKMSLARMGHPTSEETKLKISIANSGRKFTDESRKRMSISHLVDKKMAGEKHPNWIHDRTKIKTYPDKRKDANYEYWNKQCRERDSNKCKMGNEKCGGRLEVHHILRWHDYPELRYDLNNGITLCKNHHPRKKEEEIRLSPYFKELLIN